MRLIHGPAAPNGAPRIALSVDRLTLAKRRWRCVAEDGAEFGFDLDEPLADGVAFYATDEACYVIAQRPENVLEIALDQSAEAAARLGWMLGNLHFPIEITDRTIRLADDPAARQMLDREGVKFAASLRAFHPIKSGANGHQH